MCAGGDGEELEGGSLTRGNKRTIKDGKETVLRWWSRDSNWEFGFFLPLFGGGAGCVNRLGCTCFAYFGLDGAF